MYHIECDSEPNIRSEKMKINDVIRTRRESLGMTRTAFAEKMGISMRRSALIEQFPRDHRVSTIVRICKVLGLRPEDLIQCE